MNVYGDITIGRIGNFTWRATSNAPILKGRRSPLPELLVPSGKSQKVAYMNQSKFYREILKYTATAIC